jgi:hypothetical protein
VSWLDDPLVKAAVPLAPERVLRTLARVATDDSPPFVTVHLSGGHVLDGDLVTVGVDHGNDVVMLVNPQTGELGYALLSSVLAVQLRNPAPFSDMLTEGRVPLPQAGEPVTRLALQREFTPTEKFPVDVDWPALGGSDRVIARCCRGSVCRRHGPAGLGAGPHAPGGTPRRIEPVSAADYGRAGCTGGSVRSTTPRAG